MLFFITAELSSTLFYTNKKNSDLSGVFWKLWFFCQKFLLKIVTLKNSSILYVNLSS